MNRFLLWLAQGCGVGRIPVAPGTFGSFAGLLLFALLLLTSHLWLYIAGTLIGLGLSIWLCGVGERVLAKKDPGSVVFDEVAAIPLCFLGWIAWVNSKTGAFPAPEYFFSKANWMPTLLVVAAFRLFDIWKPWPVRQSQALHSGLGITVDDALAAVYVNAVVIACLAAGIF